MLSAVRKSGALDMTTQKTNPYKAIGQAKGILELLVSREVSLKITKQLAKKWLKDIEAIDYGYISWA